MAVYAITAATRSYLLLYSTAVPFVPYLNLAKLGTAVPAASNHSSFDSSEESNWHGFRVVLRRSTRRYDSVCYATAVLNL